MNTPIINTKLPRQILCKDSSHNVDLKSALTQAIDIIGSAGWDTQEELAHHVDVLGKLNILLGAIK